MGHKPNLARHSGRRLVGIVTAGVVCLFAAACGGSVDGSSPSGSRGAAPLVHDGRIDCISQIDYSELSQALYGQVLSPVAAPSGRLDIGNRYDSCSVKLDREGNGVASGYDPLIMTVKTELGKASESYWPTDELVGIGEDGTPNWGFCVTNGTIELVDVEGWTDAAVCEDEVFTALLVGRNAEGGRELLTCDVFLSSADGRVADWGLGVDVCNQAKSQVVL